MLTIQNEPLHDSASTVKDAAAQALRSQSPEDFEHFERFLGHLDAAVRELHQSMYAAETRAAIRNLESNKPLAPEQCEAVREYIVADAVHYIAHENNVQEWSSELNRLVEEICRLTRTEPTKQSIGELRALIIDATRLVPSLRHFFDDKQRIEKFDLAIANPDAQARTILARVLREQLDSPNR